jgi:hypothetical protein
MHDKQSAQQTMMLFWSSNANGQIKYYLRKNGTTYLRKHDWEEMVDMNEGII